MIAKREMLILLCLFLIIFLRFYFSYVYIMSLSFVYMSTVSPEAIGRYRFPVAGVRSCCELADNCVPT